MMRNLKADDARTMGVLSACGTMVIGIAFIVLSSPDHSRLILIVIDILMAAIAWLFLSAKNIHIDGTDLLIERTKDVIDRVQIDDISAIRTWPCIFKLNFLRLTISTGDSAFTVVREQDLTWIMSQMPTESITPYWRRRIGR